MIDDADILACRHGRFTFRYRDAMTERIKLRTLAGAPFLSPIREPLIVLEQNSHIVPPGLDLAGAAQDLFALDLLRPRFNRLRQLTRRAEDTEAALGSDLMSMALEGYALAKVLGKGAELETLKNPMSARFSRRSRSRAEVAA